jgi:hypothetical protein
VAGSLLRLASPINSKHKPLSEPNKDIDLMKRTFLPKLVGVSALALGLAVLPSRLPASATGTATDPTAPTATQSPVDTANPADTDDDVQGDRDFDWGWLGLLGLIGLAGLARKDHHDDTVTRYREPDEVSSSSSNPRY